MCNHKEIVRNLTKDFLCATNVLRRAQSKAVFCSETYYYWNAPINFGVTNLASTATAQGIC